MNNTLIHHGVKGQRWGFRKYQNPDGSLTKAGLRQQRKLRKIAAKIGIYNPDNSLDNDKYYLPTRMSNKELEEITTRIRALDSYNKAVHDSKFATAENINDSVQKINKYANTVIGVYNTTGKAYDIFKNIADNKNKDN